MSGGSVSREAYLRKKTVNMSDAKMTPLNMIDHHGMGDDNVDSGLVNQWIKDIEPWCASEPKPHWTMFESCTHACQVMYPVCNQFPCKICNPVNFDGKKCQAVRSFKQGSLDTLAKVRAAGVQVTHSTSFYSACFKGCRSYVNKKNEKGASGPACQDGGSPTESTRLAFQKEFAEECKTSKGRMDLAAKTCWCDGEGPGGEKRVCKARGKKSAVDAIARPCVENTDYFTNGTFTWISGFMAGCDDCTCV